LPAGILSNWLARDADYYYYYYCYYSRWIWRGELGFGSCLAGGRFHCCARASSLRVQRSISRRQEAIIGRRWLSAPNTQAGGQISPLAARHLPAQIPGRPGQFEWPAASAGRALSCVWPSWARRPAGHIVVQPAPLETMTSRRSSTNEHERNWPTLLINIQMMNREILKIWKWLRRQSIIIH